MFNNGMIPEVLTHTSCDNVTTNDTIIYTAKHIQASREISMKDHAELMR